MNSLRIAVFGSQKVPIFALKRCFHLSAALRDETKPSYYEVLQIPQNSTHTEIRDAYYKLSKLYHPDVKKDENSLAMFRKITEAYDVLGSVRTRLEYDNKFLGKYQPYDTSKQEFYASIYRDRCADGVSAPEVGKVLHNKSKLDIFLDQEYKDRVAEYRMFKNRLYEHHRINDTFGGEFAHKRTLFCMLLAAGFASIEYLEMRDDIYTVW